MPAAIPMSKAGMGGTTAAEALDATKPASHPLAHRLASGFPKRTRVTV